jgi:DtxR family Mn-dependent transcriptional regulator
VTQHERIAESVEMYLKAIAELAYERDQVPVTSIANKLGISTVSASEMVHRLQEQQLLKHTPYKGVRLTTLGVQKAHRVIRRQRLWERFLVDELGIPWELANRFACRLEHGTGPEVADALANYLGNPETCPHGNPIPSAEGEMMEMKGIPLTDLEVGDKGAILRIHPEGENETLCSYLAEHGIVPGKPLTVEKIEPFEGPMTICVEDHEHILGRKAAAFILVERTGE